MTALTTRAECGAGRTGTLREPLCESSSWQGSIWLAVALCSLTGGSTISPTGRPTFGIVLQPAPKLCLLLLPRPLITSSALCSGSCRGI